jgi:DNA repair exonuclease SbcCD nuclease subunit
LSKEIRFVHISDTHLGAATLGRKTTPQGISLREEDMCRSFEAAIDKILLIKPDFVLHSGDLFHSVRPSNRIINFTLRQIQKLSQASIPTVMITGNHDFPRQVSAGSIHSIFEIFPFVHPVYRGTYETKEIIIDRNQTNAEDIIKVLIHCIPQCAGDDLFKAELAKLRTIDRDSFNILMLHGAVADIKEFSMGEFAEQLIPSSYFYYSDFDYIALGHYHEFKEVVEQKVFYAGSTERLTFKESAHKKGFVEIKLSRAANTFQLNYEFHILPARTMISLPDLDASLFDASSLEAKLEKLLHMEGIEEKIVRLKVQNIPEHIYNILPFTKINKWKNRAFFCDLRFQVAGKEGEVAGATSIGRLNQEFSDYLKSIPIEGLQKAKMVEMGLAYINQALSETEE